MSLYDELYEYGKKDITPMHMPGHKRKNLGGELPYSMDITEIDGFDNLHHMTGILGDLSCRMAQLRHCKRAYPLVGGSTCGILASIKAMTKSGDRVIMARGCHKSVYHALSLFNLKAEYIYPETDEENGFYLSVSPEAVEAAFENFPDAKLVIITSPTYEGIISDISSIAEIAHNHGAKLFVDGAHGAHLGFGCSFPADALSRGADAVVESLHKTMPALTQTAALYLSEDVDSVLFEKALGIFETSSPSYLLLSSIDRCVSLIEDKCGEIFSEYRRALNAFDSKVEGLKFLSIPAHGREANAFAFDPSKILISTARAGITGQQLAEKLRSEYNIEAEMACRNYVLCMTSICDDEASLTRLADAIIGIDNSIEEESKIAPFVYPVADALISITEAEGMKGEYVSRDSSSGRISMSYIWAYPPGIPLAVPGEIITPAILECISNLEAAGIEILEEGEKSSDEIFVRTETEK